MNKNIFFKKIKKISVNEICKKLKIKLIDGLGDKVQSSSWLIKKKDD